MPSLIFYKRPLSFITCYMRRISSLEFTSVYYTHSVPKSPVNEAALPDSHTLSSINRLMAQAQLCLCSPVIEHVHYGMCRTRMYSVFPTLQSSLKIKNIHKKINQFIKCQRRISRAMSLRTVSVSYD